MQDEAVAKAAILERKVHELIRAGKLKEAVVACKRLNGDYPDHLPGWFAASRLALKVNEPQIALRAIEQALLLSPGQPEFLLQRLVCLGELGYVDEARQLGEKLGHHDFPDAVRSSTAGEALMRVGLHEQAHRHFERAIAFEPGIGRNHYNLATTLREQGRIHEADIRLDNALLLDFGDTRAHVLRSMLRTQTADKNNIGGLTDAIIHASEDSDRAQLGFALAKEWEDLGEYENAFAALSGAASLCRSAIEYSPPTELGVMQKMQEVFDAGMVNREGGFINAAPIFIVGLPCTGAPLVDSILGAHPVVSSVGERLSFASELQKLCAGIPGARPQTPTELIELAGQVDFEALGEAYIESPRGLVAESAHFVDSMLSNFLYCGPIHLALPKAKIVMLQRDPLDTCFALYRTLFDNGNLYSYDLEEVAGYFVEYDRLTRHWLRCLGDRMHVLRYEELVSGERAVIESLLDYCGLTHDSACFANRRDVASPGVMDTGAVGLAQNYIAQLQPVRDIFEAAGIRFDPPAAISAEN